MPRPTWQPARMKFACLCPWWSLEYAKLSTPPRISLLPFHMHSEFVVGASGTLS